MTFAGATLARNIKNVIILDQKKPRTLLADCSLNFGPKQCTKNVCIRTQEKGFAARKSSTPILFKKVVRLSISLTAPIMYTPLALIIMETTKYLKLAGRKLQHSKGFAAHMIKLCSALSKIKNT